MELCYGNGYQFIINRTRFFKESAKMEDALIKTLRPTILQIGMSVEVLPLGSERARWRIFEDNSLQLQRDPSLANAYAHASVQDDSFIVGSKKMISRMRTY